MIAAIINHSTINYYEYGIVSIVALIIQGYSSVVPRDTIVSGYEYFGLQTESRRNICSEIRRNVRETNTQFFKIRIYYRSSMT